MKKTPSQRRIWWLVLPALAGVVAIGSWRARPTPHTSPTDPTERAALAGATAASAETPQRPATGDEKLAPQPSYQRLAERSAGPGQSTVQVYRSTPPGESLLEPFRKAAVELTPDEEELLEEFDRQGLAAMVAQTEYDFRHASDADRGDKQLRYITALNLVAKLSPPPAPPDPTLRAQHERYLAAAAARRKEWAHLDSAERQRREEELKTQFTQHNAQ